MFQSFTRSMSLWLLIKQSSQKHWVKVNGVWPVVGYTRRPFMIKALCGRTHWVPFLLWHKLPLSALGKISSGLVGDSFEEQDGICPSMIFVDLNIQTYLEIKHDRFSFWVQRISLAMLVMINCSSHAVYMGVLIYAVGSFEVGGCKQLSGRSYATLISAGNP